MNIIPKIKVVEIMSDVYVTLRDNFQQFAAIRGKTSFCAWSVSKHRMTFLSRFIGAGRRRQLLTALLLGHPQHSSAINSRGKAARLYVRVARCSCVPSARARGPGTCCQLIITAAAMCYIDTRQIFAMKRSPGIHINPFHSIVDFVNKLPRSDLAAPPIIIRTRVFYESSRRATRVN